MPKTENHHKLSNDIKKHLSMVSLIFTDQPSSALGNETFRNCRVTNGNERWQSHPVNAPSEYFRSVNTDRNHWSAGQQFSKMLSISTMSALVDVSGGSTAAKTSLRLPRFGSGRFNIGWLFERAGKSRPLNTDSSGGYHRPIPVQYQLWMAHRR